MRIKCEIVLILLWVREWHADFIIEINEDYASGFSRIIKKDYCEGLSKSHRSRVIFVVA